MKVAVISECTHRAGLVALYERQLGAAGIPYHLEIRQDAVYPQGLRMLGHHIELLKKWLDKYGDSENLVITDAWDVLFYGTAEDVARKVPREGVLFCAERNCFPDKHLEGYFGGDTPWKYCNSGVMACKPKELEKWIASIEADPSALPGFMDQQFYNHRVLRNDPLTKIDNRTNLIYSMYLESGEMQFADGKPFNTVTKNYPNFIHFNGKQDSTLFLWKEAMSKALVTA